MVTFNKILLTHDGSDLASKAIPHAISLASKYDAEVLLLHVLPTMAQQTQYFQPAGVPAVASNVIEISERAIKIEKEAAEKQLVKIEEEFKTVGIGKIRIFIEEGFADEEIIKLAKKEKCNLIVMSTHGRSGLGRVLLGSVADSIVRQGPCPVMLIHPHH